MSPARNRVARSRPQSVGPNKPGGRGGGQRGQSDACIRSGSRGRGWEHAGAGSPCVGRLHDSPHSSNRVDGLEGTADPRERVTDPLGARTRRQGRRFLLVDHRARISLLFGTAERRVASTTSGAARVRTPAPWPPAKRGTWPEARGAYSVRSLERGRSNAV
jgi:hypothetical protein